MKIKKLADVPTDATVRIVKEDVVFTAYVGDTAVASCPSARRLSNWCLDNGALRVKHEYDLREDT